MTDPMVCHIGDDFAFGGLTLNFTRPSVLHNDLEFAVHTDGFEAGRLSWEKFDPQVMRQTSLLTLTQREAQAFWRAVAGRNDPPTESAALRAALAKADERVDKMVDAFLGTMR